MGKLEEWVAGNRGNLQEGIVCKHETTGPFIFSDKSEYRRNSY
jgi:hypothetical protein